MANTPDDGSQPYITGSEESWLRKLANQVEGKAKNAATGLFQDLPLALLDIPGTLAKKIAQDPGRAFLSIAARDNPFAEKQLELQDATRADQQAHMLAMRNVAQYALMRGASPEEAMALAQLPGPILSKVLSTQQQKPVANLSWVPDPNSPGGYRQLGVPTQKPVWDSQRGQWIMPPESVPSGAPVAAPSGVISLPESASPSPLPSMVPPPPPMGHAPDVNRGDYVAPLGPDGKEHVPPGTLTGGVPSPLPPSVGPRAVTPGGLLPRPSTAKPPATAEAALARYIAEPTRENWDLYGQLKEFEDKRKEDPRLDKSYEHRNTELTKIGSPLEQQADRLGRVVESINQRTPQADSLIAPELLTAMAGGQGSGLRMNEAEISRIVGGRTHWEDLKSAVNRWKLDPTKGLSITDAQREQISELVQAIQSRVQAKLDIVDEAAEQLITAKTPDEQKRILAQAKKKLHAISKIGLKGATGGAVDSIFNSVQGKAP